eukprot:scaffold95068_cov47-Prasinocladus_malaysianus.AAC.2
MGWYKCLLTIPTSTRYHRVGSYAVHCRAGRRAKSEASCRGKGNTEREACFYCQTWKEAMTGLAKEVVMSRHKFTAAVDAAARQHLNKGLAEELKRMDVCNAFVMSEDFVGEVHTDEGDAVPCGVFV